METGAGGLPQDGGRVGIEARRPLLLLVVAVPGTETVQKGTG